MNVYESVFGAVISHTAPSGEERPIANASRTLSKSERNYAQIEKEALSIVFGIKKFHQYLYGWKFTLLTDHKPLLSLLGPQSGIPTLAAARMQRWALLLSGYQYDIQYCSTTKHANADCLSRLPVAIEATQPEIDEVKLINKLQIESLPLSVDQIRKATCADPILSRVLEFTMSGWPEKPTTEEIKPYFLKRNEISSISSISRLAPASLAFVLGVECSTLTSSSSGCCVRPAVVVVSR